MARPTALCALLVLLLAALVRPAAALRGARALKLRAAAALAARSAAAGPENPCEFLPGETPSRDACLAKVNSDVGRKACMFVALDVASSACLPCAAKHAGALPCAPVGAQFAAAKVTSCDMACSHQGVLTKVSPCLDVSGHITQSQCFAKGASVFAKCLWTAYTITDDAGVKAKKTACGPCNVKGVGQVPCANPGDLGPEGLPSETDACASQCEMESYFGMPCNSALGIPAATPCAPTPAPPMLEPTPIPLEAMGAKLGDDAPNYFAVPVDAPYGAREIARASAGAARVAGWPLGTPLAPSAPLVIYGMPPAQGPTLPPDARVMFGPPPPGLNGVPPPGYGVGTLPPRSLLETQYLSGHN